MKSVCVFLLLFIPAVAFTFTDITGEYESIAYVVLGELKPGEERREMNIRQIQAVYQITITVNGVENGVYYVPLSHEDRYPLKDFSVWLEIYPIRNHLILYEPDPEEFAAVYALGITPNIAWRFWIFRKK